MKGEKLPQYTGFTYSRYKRTGDITWRLAMDKALEKERASQTQEEDGQLSFMLD